MKIRNIILSLIALSFVLAACDSMNDIQKKYAELEEQTYLGKVDSIKSYPGFGRAKITWYIDADPRIENTVIYWNNRKDSIVVPFNRTAPGLQKDSVILSNLPEGSFLFEFRNTNSRGESSLYSSATVTVWGTAYGDDLNGRSVVSKEFDYDQSSLILQLTNSQNDTTVVYSEIAYTDKNGISHTIKIGRDETSAELTDFPEGGSANLRTVFFLPEGIDTVYNDYVTINAPTVVREGWTKQSIGSGPTSRYFDRNGTLYEWNSDGDIILYDIDENGSFVQTREIPTLVSREDYYDFFFYDDDKFIGIKNTTSKNLDMLSLNLLEDSVAFDVVKAGYGNDKLYNVSEFISSHGFFYSLYRPNKALRIWYARNNASGWGSGNGKTISTDFDYTTFDLYRESSILAIDSDGYLWKISVTTLGEIVYKIKIGKGWGRFTRLVAVGRYLLAMDSEGAFWKFDFNTDNYWLVE